MRIVATSMMLAATAATIGLAAAKPPMRSHVSAHVQARAQASDALYAASVAAPGRPDEAIALDAGRKPADVLRFMMLRPGMHALDMVTGSGYYAELMGRVVGPRGSVVAFQPAFESSDKSRAKTDAVMKRQPNVTVSGDLPAIYAAGGFDFAMIHLNYHDFYWESEQYHVPRMDPNMVLAGLFKAMKPGGIVAVVDHVGPAGDTRAIVDKLHRIDPATVKADFARAGFVLEATSDLLANPADDHSKLVFDPSIRGKTDRFVFRFRKPRR